MATITTTQRDTVFGFPIWSWVTIAVMLAITTIFVVAAMTPKDAPVDRAIQAATLRYEGLAEHWAEVEARAAFERANVAVTARLDAAAEAYRFERSQQAIADRLNGLAESYGAVTPGLDAWAARYQGLADGLTGLTRAHQAVADRYSALAEHHGR